MTIETLVETEPAEAAEAKEPAAEPVKVDEPVEEQLKPAPMTDADFRTLCNLQDSLKDATAKVEEAKARLKAAKGNAEEAALELSNFIDELRHPNLFRKGAADAEKNRQAEGDAKPSDDTWRHTTLAELGIEGSLAQKLVDAELITLGAIVDYTSDGKAKLTDIKGIGEAKGKEIEDALLGYWRAHPRPQTEPEDSVEGSSEGTDDDTTEDDDGAED